jgi:hypothetical protein
MDAAAVASLPMRSWSCGQWGPSRGPREAFALIRHQIEPLTVGADRAAISS